MTRRQLHTALATLMAAGALLVVTMAPAQAIPKNREPVSTQDAVSTQQGVPAHWQKGYYTNYFRSFLTCNARGWQMMATVYGVRSFVCYQKFGQSKYTMDILWEPSSGGGGW